MLPVIAIVGRPNVGKSTLFNVLTASRDALVANLPGLTRDRQYGTGKLFPDLPHIVIDTGGFETEDEGLFALMIKQTQHAIEEAQAILFVVDGRVGLTSQDTELAKMLRSQGKPVTVVVNKTDGTDPEVAQSEFFSLGFKRVMPIAASHGRGVRALIGEVLRSLESSAEEVMSTDSEPAEVIPSSTDDNNDSLQGSEETPSENEDTGIRIAVVGRPNVGKSTLINRILGEERVLVFDAPGTTRDSIFVPFQRHGKQYTFIDTAGVRRRGRVKETVEKFSVIKTLQAIEACHIAILTIDAQEGITDQDLHLLGHIVNAGKGLIIAVNKWDGLSAETRDHVRKELQRRLTFVDFSVWHFISALHGSGVGNMFDSIHRIYDSAHKDIPTPVLTRELENAIEKFEPPLVRGRRIKLRYAHMGGHHPPTIIIHGNQTESLPNHYQRYLVNHFRKTFDLVGTPIRIILKTGVNPFAGRVNKLTPRQQRKKTRLFRRVKRKKDD